MKNKNIQKTNTFMKIYLGITLVFMSMMVFLQIRIMQTIDLNFQSIGEAHYNILTEAIEGDYKTRLLILDKDAYVERYGDDPM